MNLQQRIEEAQKQFVDGKLPQTHVLYFEQMASLDWAGPWTDEMKAHAARCVQMWMDCHQAKQKQERQEVKSFIELFPVSDERQIAKPKRTYKRFTKERIDRVIPALYKNALNYCSNRSKQLAFKDVLQSHGFRYNDALRFVVTHKIMSETEYRDLSKRRIMPGHWSHPNRPL